jgi:hypothetical protein
VEDEEECEAMLAAISNRVDGSCRLDELALSSSHRMLMNEYTI